jgi:hypothetical protein
MTLCRILAKWMYLKDVDDYTWEIRRLRKYQVELVGILSKGGLHRARTESPSRWPGTSPRQHPHHPRRQPLAGTCHAIVRSFPALAGDESGTTGVYPSGAALTTASVARLEPAPGLFSTTNCWPSRSDSHWPMGRFRIRSSCSRLSAVEASSSAEASARARPRPIVAPRRRRSVSQLTPSRMATWTPSSV